MPGLIRRERSAHNTRRTSTYLQHSAVQRGAFAMRHRRSPGDEVMEGRSLLSNSPMSALASVAHIEAAKPLVFNGTLHPFFLAHCISKTKASVAVGIHRYVEFNFKPMGKNVHLDMSLAHPTLIPAGSHVLPNLADSALHLSNSKGILTVNFAASTTNRYRYTLTGG